MKLGSKWRNVVPTMACQLPNGGVLVASRGSVVPFSGDAIVNAANQACLGGGGVDGAISKAGGPALLEARKRLPEKRKGLRCATGDAKITVGGKLQAKWCIHAVGPNYRTQMAAKGRSVEHCDHLLQSAYQRSMEVAAENNVKTLAFSLISAGVFRGPRSLQEVLDIAVAGIVQADYEGLQEVHLVAFTIEELTCLHKSLEKCKEFLTTNASVVDEGAGAPAQQIVAVARHKYAKTSLFVPVCKVCCAKNKAACKRGQDEADIASVKAIAQAALAKAEETLAQAQALATAHTAAEPHAPAQSTANLPDSSGSGGASSASTIPASSLFAQNSSNSVPVSAAESEQTEVEHLAQTLEQLLLSQNEKCEDESNTPASIEVDATHAGPHVESSETMAPKQSASRGYRILCYGDSLTAGYVGWGSFTPYATSLQMNLMSIVNRHAAQRLDEVDSSMSMFPVFHNVHGSAKSPASGDAVDLAENDGESSDNVEHVGCASSGSSGHSAGTKFVPKKVRVDYEGASGITAMYLSSDGVLETDNTESDAVGTPYAGLIHALSRGEPYDVCLIMIGTNDLACVLEKQVSVNHVLKCITKLHQVCHKASVPTLALSIPPNHFSENNEEYKAIWDELNQ
eukprot:INCI9528.2.p1 GENE.INCI9528.2~~INCI9528.2.p1  ORF type:complete len:647 (-),score=130.09 INCI9528.2:1613-3493(-)